MALTDPTDVDHAARFSALRSSLGRGLALAVGVFWLVASVAAVAGSLPAGWKLVTRPGIRAAAFEQKDAATLEVRSEGGFGLLYREIPSDQRVMGRLSWEWRLDATFPPTDLRSKGGDDRPLAIHLLFPEADGSFGLLTTFKGSLGRLLGLPPGGRALTYVWGGDHAVGETFVNPYADQAFMIVLRGGDAPTGRWFREQVDIASDFERLFGHPAPAAAFVAISTDGDDLGGASIGYVANLGFSGVR
jgi:hypothetical protein